jgi:hypothetical protein
MKPNLVRIYKLTGILILVVIAKVIAKLIVIVLNANIRDTDADYSIYRRK